MSFYDYSKFKIRIAPDSGKRQGLEVGDIVRRQYTDGGRTRYSLMAVLETGTDTVEGPDGTSLSSPYFIGALVDGDEPREGELLDFVRLTSLTDPSRSGALYLTGSEGDSPYMDVIDGMAVQRSLCRPEGVGEDGYGCIGAGQVEVSYSESEGSVFRAFTIVKKDIQTSEDIGIRQVLPATLDHPRRVAVSFRAKAGKPMTGVPIGIGYSDGTQSDGAATFDVRPQWDYHLLLVTIDYPPTVERVLQIGLAGHLTDQGDTFSVADLNVVALDELSDYGRATKGRVGRITGIADPLFGVLDGYGAYFQNLYATRNVSVAGTLTAGDGDGFASTFYAGRIHKNVLRDSLNPKFTTGVTEGTSLPPAGIGKTFTLPGGETMLECQREEWAQAHEGKRYCFSFWAYSEAAQTLSVRYGDKVIGTVEASPSWQRHSLRLRILSEAGQPMQVGLTAPQPWVFTSPQLEAGNHATLYQPTDAVLDETEGYGAWFNKGGIGGTIQNPLLKLEADGSIRSAGGSFVINADGTGYFAGGKLKWDREQIVLEDLTIDWEQVAGHMPGLDWIQDWDTNKTHLGAELVVTPKLFAGEKHDDGLVTGIALGRFPLAMYDGTQGGMAVRQIDGIAGFDHGRKVFSVESTGDVELGFGGQSIRYNAATGQIEFGAGVSMHWIGATYIDPDGIFTGTLSAETVRAVEFDASQITAGTIDAARIDTDILKTVLLTSDNIEALTLNVRQGTIGGWTIDDTGIYRGTKKDIENTLCDNPSDMTLGGSGIRGRMWRLDAGGAGALAGENIRWDAAGNVFFASSVSLAWQSGIDAASELAQSVGAELSQHPLTYIGATGIYTGSLTAQQITAGFLSAERFEAGSIKAEKLDADSIKASIVNAAYINGLDCIFDKGTIGGWRIGTTTLSADHILLDSANRRMAVYGKDSGTQDGRRVQLYYTDADDFGLLATDGAGSGIVQLGSVNRIAGWNIDAARIYKGNVALGADGSVQNGEKWQFNNDGSGRIAGGNIAWDTAGAVTFSPAVSVSWQNDIQSAKTKDYGFAYQEDIVVYGDENLYYPVVLKGGEQTIKREIVVRRGYDEQAPSSWNPNISTHHGGLILSIKANFGNWGGINYSWDIYELSELYCRMFAGAENCGNQCMFAIFLRGGGTGGALYHMYSDQPLVSSFASPGSIPPAPQICYNREQIFDINGRLDYAPAPRTLTAAVNEEIRRHRFIALAQNTDTTLSQHPLTYIGPTGIYTGTLTALQVNAVDIDAMSIRTGTLSTDRLAAGSIKAEKLDAASLKASVINTDYINGLSCTFSQGKIGGWTIGGDSLWTGTLGLIGSTPVQLRPTSAGSGEWYLGRYKPMGISVTWHQTGNAGHIVFGQVASAGNAPKTGYIGIQMMDWDNTEYFCLSANYTRSGSKEIYNRIAGWAFDSARIWKNGVSLGSDGSIQNSAKWQLNNDGSGRVASGNIAWDAAGNVSFGASVSLQWRRGQLYVRGTDVNHNATRIVRVNGTDILNGFGRGFFLTVLNRSDLSTVSNTQYDVYANEVTCNNLAVAMNALASDKIVILTSCDAITVNAALQSAIERCGGNSWTGTGRFPFAFIGIPGIGKGNGLMAMYGDTASDPHAEIVTQVIDGVPVGVNLGAKRFTHIDGNGIYTGTVSAGQIHVDTDLVVGGSSYNGSISVRDAANSVKVTLNRAGITAVGGTIGGWSLNATQIYSGTVVLSKDGTIGNGNRWKLGADGSGYLANNNFAWNVSGSIYARACMLEDVTVAGTLRNHFVKHGSTVTFPGASPVQASPNTHDNIIIVQGTQSQTVTLPWTSDQSGRRLCLVNYLWSGTVTQGDVAITAPSGYWFYENGIGQQTLRISRELVELIGYGSDTTFNGWIVVNRRAVMSSSYQGMDQQILAQGAVTCSKATSRGVSMYYKTFDGKQLQVAHTKQGYFTVYLPWTIPAEQYMVMLTGKTSAVQNTSIYASVRDQYSTYFTVSTQDDDSANDGSFNFQIISTAGFSVYSQL